MKVIIQRVVRGSVRVDDQLISSIGAGVVCLVGLKTTDTDSDLDWMANKLLNLRLWAKENKTWAKSVLSGEKEVLLVSQFTLYGTAKRGNKPDFHQAMAPDQARLKYAEFVEKVKHIYRADKVKDGAFGEMMQVELVNDGPVTFTLSSDEVQHFKPKAVAKVNGNDARTPVRVACSPGRGRGRGRGGNAQTGGPRGRGGGNNPPGPPKVVTGSYELVQLSQKLSEVMELQRKQTRGEELTEGESELVKTLPQIQQDIERAEAVLRSKNAM